VRRWIRKAVVLAVTCAWLVPATVVRAASDPPPLPLELLFDNVAVSEDARPDEADFDGFGASLSARDLTAAGWTPGRELTVQGARLTWPGTRPGEPDNVRAAGQRVRLYGGSGDALAFLVAGTAGRETGGAGSVTYTDGSSSAFRLTAPDWRTGPPAEQAVGLPHVNTEDGRLDEKARLYVRTVPLLPGRSVASVRLPRARDLHVFSLSVRDVSRGWSGSWAASTSGRTSVGPWTDRTLRLVVHTSAGGSRIRVRLENTFADRPVRIGGATVAVRASGAGARGEPVRLSFRGRPEVVVPAGAQAYSDPLGFEVPADTDLLVSLHLPGTVRDAPLHAEALQRSYLSEPGDHTGDRAPGAFGTEVTTWPLLTGVDVSGGPGSVVVLGNSITDGIRSTPDANRRWTDVLADRLRAQHTVPRYGVLNHGISGNRVLSDRYPGDGVSSDVAGVSALHRFDRDVLAQTSARTAVVFMGVNDLRWGWSPDEVIEGLRELVERGRERGLRMLGTTLLPCEGESRCTAAVDAGRVAVNAWIRSSGVFDGVLDFDAVLRDPGHPSRMLPAYDSGDHLHPGDAGYAALAESVDLRELAGGP